MPISEASIGNKASGKVLKLKLLCKKRLPAPGRLDEIGVRTFGLRVLGISACPMPKSLFQSLLKLLIFGVSKFLLVIAHEKADKKLHRDAPTLS